MAQKLFCPVYICGVSGAGKTTLANRIVGQIKKDYPQGNVPRIQEIARQIISDKSWTREDLEQNDEIFFQLQKEIVHRQLEAESQLTSPFGYISDRGLMDPVAYTHFRLGPEAAEELKRIIQEQNPAALAALRKSLVVLLGPHSVNVEDDGVRLICQDPEKLTAIYRNILNDWNVPFADFDDKCITDIDMRTKLLLECMNGCQSFRAASFRPQAAGKKKGKQPSGSPQSFPSPQFQYYMLPPNNSAVRKISIKEHRYVQSTMVFEKGKSNRYIERYGCQDLIIFSFDHSLNEDVVFKILKAGVFVNKELYNFIGCSPAGLSEGECYLLKGQVDDIESRLKECGQFDALNLTAKFNARIGLLFGKVTLTDICSSDFDVKEVDDVKSKDGRYTFTDGCGIVGKTLLMKVRDSYADKMEALKDDSVPSVVQIRWRGLKGVLALSTDTNIVSENQLVYRPSMEKVNMDSFDKIGICGFSRPYGFGHLNVQFVRILSGCGISDETLMLKQMEFLKMVLGMTVEFRYAFYILQWKGKFDQLNMTSRSAMEKWYDPTTPIADLLDESQRRFLRKYQQKLLLNSKKLRIMIPESRHVYGVCDPFGILKPGECFFRPVIRGVPTTIKGKILVMKNPTYLCSDVCVLTGVDSVHNDEVKRLEEDLVDCLVFPIKGKVPHPQTIGGSDLDGDKYFVCWDQDLIPRGRGEYLYPDAKNSKNQDVSHTGRVRHFAQQHTGNNILLNINRYFDHWANVRGIDSDECNRLGQLHSLAIDAVKTGVKVDIPRDLTPTQLDEKTSEKSDSSKLLNKLYHNAANVKSQSLQSSIKDISRISIDNFTEEDIHLALADENAGVNDFELFDFVSRWATCQFPENFESRQKFLMEISKSLDFASFTREELKKVQEAGVSEEVIFHVKSKLKLQLPDEVTSDLDKEKRLPWKLFFQGHHDQFDFDHILKAITTYKENLVILALDIGVRLVFHFKHNFVTGKSLIENGSCFFVEKNDRHHQLQLDSGYEAEVDYNKIQIYPKDKGQGATIWQFKRSDGSASCTSIGLDPFKAKLRENGHPLITKLPIINIEMFFRDPKGRLGNYIDVSDLNEESVWSDPPNDDTADDKLRQRDENTRETLTQEKQIIHSLLSVEHDPDVPSQLHSSKEELKAGLNALKESLALKQFADNVMQLTDRDQLELAMPIYLTLVQDIQTKLYPWSISPEHKVHVRDTMVKFLAFIKKPFRYWDMISKVNGLFDTTPIRFDKRSFTTKRLTSFYENSELFFNLSTDDAECLFKSLEIAHTSSLQAYLFRIVTSEILALIRNVNVERQVILENGFLRHSIFHLKLCRSTDPKKLGKKLNFYRIPLLDHFVSLKQGMLIHLTPMIQHLSDDDTSFYHLSLLGKVVNFTSVPFMLEVNIKGQVPCFVQKCQSGELDILWRVDPIPQSKRLAEICETASHICKNPPASTDESMNIFDKVSGGSYADYLKLPSLDCKSNADCTFYTDSVLDEILKEPLTFIEGDHGSGKTYVCLNAVGTALEAGIKEILVCSNGNLSALATRYLRRKLGNPIILSDKPDRMSKDMLHCYKSYDEFKRGDSDRKVVFTKVDQLKRVLSAASFELVLIDDAHLVFEADMIPIWIRGVRHVVILSLPCREKHHRGTRLTLQCRMRHVHRTYKLPDQHRCPPAVCAFKPLSITSQPVDKTSKVREISCFYVDVKGRETKGRQSIINTGEVEAIQRLLKLKTFSEWDKVSILTYHVGQKFQLLECLKFPKKNIHLVGEFQGLENDYIIIATTRTAGKHMGVLDDLSLFRTALTRAKRAMYVFGSWQFMRESRIWSQWFDFAKEFVLEN